MAPGARARRSGAEDFPPSSSIWPPRPRSSTGSWPSHRIARMCRLFGMSGGMHEVEATFWLLDAPSSLLVQSEGQPDGVGLGTFDADGTPRIYRKPVSANRSQTFIASAQAVRSRTFLSHIRHATAGAPTLENTHPFEHQGRIFAHNGVIGDLPGLRRRLDDHLDLVRGTTDSELFFAL